MKLRSLLPLSRGLLPNTCKSSASVPNPSKILAERPQGRFQVVAAALCLLAGSGALVAQTCGFPEDVVFASDFEFRHATDGKLFPARLRVRSADAPALSLHVGHFNGDEIPDLVTGGDDLAVLFGRAGARPEAVWVEDQSSREITVVDLDEDGLDDFVVGTVLELLAYMNQGGGKFTVTEGPQVDIDVLNGDIVAGDFNGDGVPDVAVSSAREDRISIFAGDGTGNLTEINDVFADSFNMEKLAARDFDGDGDLDLVLTDAVSDSVTVLAGDGDGSFDVVQEIFLDDTNPGHIAVGDLDSDGALDLVTANGSPTVGVLLGAGDGTFANATLLQTEREHGNGGIGLADIDGDGHLDIVVQNTDTDPPNAAKPRGLSILYGTGTGSFGDARLLASGASPFGRDGALAIADFDADGRTDVAVGGLSIFTDGGFSLIRGVPGRQLDAPERYAVPDFSGKIFAFADIDDNGVVDLAVPAGQDLALLLDPLEEGARVQSRAVLDNRPSSLDSADLDGDGRSDFVIGDTRDNQVVLLYGDGTDDFLDSEMIPIDDPDFVRAADLNGNGHQDIVTSGSAGTSVLANTVSGGFTEAGSLETGASSALMLRDMDLDGHRDIVMGGFTGIAIFYGDGNLDFTEEMVFSAEDRIEGLAVGDFNSDGRPDLIVSGPGGSSQAALGWFPGLPDRAFGSRQEVPVDIAEFSAPQFGVAAADFDLDGDDDVVGIGFNAILMLNDGAGNFQPVQSLPGGDDGTRIDTRDVNGDGFPEIALLNRDSDDIIVYENLCGLNR